MYKAVPATGRVRSAAIMETPAQRAASPEKHLEINRWQARRNRKMEANCQKKSTTSSGKWLHRTEAAIKFGKNVMWAWDSKNCALNGNSAGWRIFSTPGR